MWSYLFTLEYSVILFHFVSWDVFHAFEYFHNCGFNVCKIVHPVDISLILQTVIASYLVSVSKLTLWCFPLVTFLAKTCHIPCDYGFFYPMNFLTKYSQRFLKNFFDMWAFYFSNIVFLSIVDGAFCYNCPPADWALMHVVYSVPSINPAQHQAICTVADTDFQHPCLKCHSA